MSAVPPVTLSTEQLVAAFLQGALQLAGPTGLAVSALIPAAQQLLDGLLNHQSANFTVADLSAIVAKGNADLSTLIASGAAQDAAAKAKKV